MEGYQTLKALVRQLQNFIILEPESVRGKEAGVATIKGAFKYGKIVPKIPKVDLVVEGSVTVDMHGNRLGKGGGYGDREIRAVNDKSGDVLVVSACHPVQIVKEVPAGNQDEKIDIIVTPDRIHHIQR